MKNQVLINKYSYGLVQAVADEGEFQSVCSELGRFFEIFSGHKDLQKVLISPFLSQKKKSALLEDILGESGVGDKPARFLRLLLKHKRLELLGDVLCALPEAWNEKQGILSFRVTSVVPLSEPQKARLKAELEKLEKKPVSLAYTLDPGIIGGLTLKKGHIVYDASVQGSLMRIREIIREE